MVFKELELSGAYLIEPDRHEDERGFFARTWCRREFEDHGLNPQLVQCSMSRSLREGTLRGLHYQSPPHAEAKLVRCTAGAIYDVIVDLRPGSPTFRQHVGLVLSAGDNCALYVPEGLAHGFLTLADRCDVFYQMSAFYEPAAARGVRWNDPAFGIRWPAPIRVISERDRSYPDFIASGVQLSEEVAK